MKIKKVKKVKKTVSISGASIRCDECKDKYMPCDKCRL